MFSLFYIPCNPCVRTPIDVKTQLLSKVNWSDYNLSGTTASKLQEKEQTNIGRVVEETIVSYRSMGLGAVLAAGAVGATVLARSGRLRLR
jgi:hypothetical protein